MDRMREGEAQKIRLGVSACLLGQEVRYDGGHKRDRFLIDTLGRFVEWVPVCPEVEIGLGIPRDRIRLVGDAAAPRLIVEKTGDDLTARMQRYARARTLELESLDLHGYVLKRGSPSCGLFRVRVYDEEGVVRGNGTGAYARVLTERFPQLPVEEEGRLGDPALRENFIERVFAMARWRTFVARRPGAGDLVAFHTAQKFAVLAHSPSHYATLGRLVAAVGGARLAARVTEYGTLLMQALSIRATRARHANVLQHLTGFFKRQLEAAQRVELADVIHDYRLGLVPLVVPLTLIKHHVRRLGVAYLADQVYLSPHPKELMLRNHV
jgi:uncharacterized protein YbgA (DUF1722 family)/uncharacterized protein YbbK (DUF523 family)